MKRRSTTLLASAVGLAALAAGAAPAQATLKLRQAGDHSPLGNELLSDERTLSRWASPFRIAPIRSAPGSRARKVGRLRHWTEDGPREVYLALRSRLDADGRAWVQVRIPGRPNGRKGWVRETDLEELKVVFTQLVIDRRRLSATLYRRGRRILFTRVGVGKPGTITPAGRFYVRERLRGLGGAYGPWAFGTSAYSPTLTDWPNGGIVGIHGTDRPDLIPGRPSHGCVRVPNRKVRRLARLMPIGTPVLIR